MKTARLVVVTPPELAPGFRLAGAATVVALDAEAAHQAMHELLPDDSIGVIALYEPYLDAAPEKVRRRWLDSVEPVVVALPAATAPDAASRRRARLAELLQDAVGYQLTFGGEET